MTHDNPEMRQRRELLKRAAWLLGGAVSAPAALAILQGCSARDPAEAPAALKFLTAAQMKTVAEVAEIMIPRTDTSGARDAGVPEFIDRVLHAVYAPEDRQRFTTGLSAFEPEFRRRDAEGRATLVKQALDSALAADEDDKPFILMTRELTLLGYFTSKVGILENMEYVPVPAAFHACVPVSQLKKPVYWE